MMYTLKARRYAVTFNESDPTHSMPLCLHTKETLLMYRTSHTAEGLEQQTVHPAAKGGRPGFRAPKRRLPHPSNPVWAGRRQGFLPRQQP